MRRQHSRSGTIRCDICAPLRCTKADAKLKTLKPVCEVCEEVIQTGVTDRYSCNTCGHYFGPCCNSLKDSLCVECFQ